MPRKPSRPFSVTRSELLKDSEYAAMQLCSYAAMQLCILKNA